MAERDPRVDPRPGDVLSNGAVIREVKGVYRPVVWYYKRGELFDREVHLKSWRALVKGAKVVTRGE